MQLKCIAVGKNMPEWITQGVQEYQKRLQHTWPLDFIEIAPNKRSKNSSVQQNMETEAHLIEQHCQTNEKRIVLAVEGKLMSTEQLAEKCDRWQQETKTINFIIGGPDGIAPSIKQRADFLWSLSPLTLPHPIVRVLLAEQLYRAWSILQGHPYHRS